MKIKLNAKLSAYSNVNLKKLAEHTYLYYGTLTTRWDGTTAPYTQRIFVDGLLATDDPMAIVDIVLSSDWDLAVEQDQQWSNIKKITIEDNAVVAYSETAIDIPLNIVIKVTR